MTVGPGPTRIGNIEWWIKRNVAWKQVAKGYREQAGLLLEELQTSSQRYYYRKWVTAQADADRLRELMLKQDRKTKVCQFCYRHLKWDKDIQRMVGHTDDCELAKELADEDSEGGIQNAPARPEPVTGPFKKR